MFTQITPDVSPLLGASVVVAVLYPLLLAGAIALTMRVLYSVIWRAVRRGLREFHQPAATSSPTPTRRT